MRSLALRRSRQGQKGGIAIIVGLSLAVVIGFAGLALDGGRLYVNKSELQNAADACALSAAQELAGAPSIAPAAFTAGHNAGMTVVTLNRTDFQDGLINAGDVTIEFGTSLTGGSWLTAAATPPGNAKYVRCTLQHTGISPWFMRLAGFGDATVRAAATATLVNAPINCAVPLSMCAQSPTSPFGLVPGHWYDGRFDSGGGLTGSFNWIDFTPPGGGASELANLLTGGGQCSLSATNPVGQSGSLGNAAARAWNTRFGLYSGSYNRNNAPPDSTGYAYTPTNWPERFDAYNGTSASGKPNYRAQRNNHAPYGATVDAGNAETGLSLSNAYNPTTTAAQHAQYGASRRLATVPIVNCADWGSSQTVSIRGWACILMLNPIQSPGDTVYMEYLGLADDATTPCSTGGVPGSPTSTGPLVPGLVQ
jgi:hypothetical protein